MASTNQRPNSSQDFLGRKNRHDYEAIVNYESEDDTDDDDNVLDKSASDSFQNISKLVLVFIIMGSLSLLIASSVVQTSTSDSNDDTSSDYIDKISLVGDEVITFTLNRVDYEPLNMFTEDKSTIVKYTHLKSYYAVIEPYADMELYLDDDSLISEGFVYEYTICDYSKKTGVGTDCYTGKYSSNDSQSINIACNPFDKYQIALIESYANIQTRNVTGYALCQYVRREIRTLSDIDLSDTMDAMFAIWDIAEEDGQEAYGENFHSEIYFAEAHNFNAAQVDSDHIHEGMGFLPQHIKISNIFELSMQAYNPAVSLPYWDFTIDNKEELMISESPMFTPDTFGSITLPVDSDWGWTYSNDSIADSAIPDGRWKLLKADLNTKYDDLGNSFGYMRGPWNYNPSPYISRFTTATYALPSCSSYSMWIQLDDFVDFMNIAPFAPHASTHGGIGSVYGCDMFIPLLDEGLLKNEPYLFYTCKKWGFYLKEFYRSSLISRADTSDCNVDSLDYDGISCGIVCPTDDDDLAALLTIIRAQVRTTVVTTDNAATWKAWRDWLCEGDAYRVFVGDHLESASPSDPSFWPIHGTLERLYQLKLMVGGFDDTTWPTEGDDVCDKYYCYEPDISTEKGNYTNCCYGHYENDQLLDFINSDVYAGVGDTNKEVMDNTDPTNKFYSMPYIYDDLMWSHCNGSENDDDNFADIIEKLYDENSRRKRR